jgi:hypothetical protein
MSKDGEAKRIAELLGIKYAHAVRLIRETSKELDEDATFSDLAHACRALKEQEESKRRFRPKGALPKAICGRPLSEHAHSEYPEDER